MSKSETMLAPPSLLPPPPKKTKSSSSLQRTSSTHSLPDEMSFTNVSQEDVSDAGSIIGSVSGHSITTTIITTAAAANGGGAYSSSSSSSIGRAVVPLEVMSHRHRHGTIALLALIKPVEFVDTGLNAADGTAVMAVLESFEARTSVNIIWFTCLKVGRELVVFGFFFQANI